MSRGPPLPWAHGGIPRKVSTCTLSGVPDPQPQAGKHPSPTWSRICRKPDVSSTERLSQAGPRVLVRQHGGMGCILGLALGVLRVWDCACGVITSLRPHGRTQSRPRTELSPGSTWSFQHQVTLERSDGSAAGAGEGKPAAGHSRTAPRPAEFIGKQSFHLQPRVRSVREDRLELAFPKVTLLELGEGQDGTGLHTPTWVPPAPAPQRSP